MRKQLIRIGILSVALSLLAACSRGRDFHLASTTEPARGGSSSAPATSAATMPVLSYADVVSRAAPAVVTIHSQMRVRQPQQYPFMDDPFFRRFFGERTQQAPPVEQTRQALGSGV